MKALKPALLFTTARVRAIIAFLTSPLIFLLQPGTAAPASPAAAGASHKLNPNTTLVWVPAYPREGHAEACARHGLNPSSHSVFFSSAHNDEVCGETLWHLVNHGL